MARTRILCAEDHLLVAEGVHKLLEGDGTFECVGMVTDGRALLHTIDNIRPDVVLLDISLPLLNGLDAIRWIRREQVLVKIIILTMHADKSFVLEAFRLGANGYVLKQCASSELFFALRAVRNGYTYITPSVTQVMVESLLEQHNTGETAKVTPLTWRQREILQLIAEGKNNKEIAHVLNISSKTVEFHKTHLTKTLGIRTIPEITKYACAHGIVSLESLRMGQFG